MESKVKSASEGGWGYAVCFGTVITFISCIGHINSFGLIYHEFMIETKSTAKSLTTATGVFGMMLAIGGIILNVLPKTMSLRVKGLLGALCFCTGAFMTIIITNTNQLPITFGVLQGIGFGIMVPVSYSAINFYFVRRRTTVFGACKTIQGITLMCYPQLIKKLITSYGFRGTLIILSAISLHTFAGMGVMKTETKKILQQNAANDAESGHLKNDEDFELLNYDDPRIVDIPADDSEAVKSKFQLSEIFGMNILRNKFFLNICFGQSFTNFSDVTFFVLQPMLMFQYGYDQSQVATCISIGAAADLAGRCALTMISTIISINTRLLYYLAALLTMGTRIVLLQVHQLSSITAVTALLGVLRALTHIASPLVISNQVTHEEFPGAYSILMLLTGLVNLTLSPFIGLLKDYYDDYTPAFYALSACCLPCVILWPIEYALRRK